MTLNEKGMLLSTQQATPGRCWVRSMENTVKPVHDKMPRSEECTFCLQRSQFHINSYETANRPKLTRITYHLGASAFITEFIK
jgi:hypothetical protein